MITGRYGRRHVPTTGMGWGTAAVGGIFGAFWTIMAFTITSGAPDVGGFAVAKVFFPLFGVAFTVGAVMYGVYIVRKAEEYNRAFAAYQQRRAAVERGD
jgi:hypothetical protein